MSDAVSKRSPAVLPAAAGMLIVTVGLVSPGGDFPLNDDWVYASSVCSLVEDQRWLPHPLAGVVALSHTLWGSLFSLVFGLDFESLRLSTLFLALVTLWAVARSALEIGLGRPTALLAAAVVLANPIFLNLSYTFMSDAALLAPLSLAGLFYLRALSRGRRADLTWAGVFGALAFFTRQLGLLIAVAFALVSLLQHVRGAKRIEPGDVVAFGTPWALAGALALAIGGLSGGAPGFESPGLLFGLARLPGDGAVALVYVGLFVLPMAVAALAVPWGGMQRREWGPAEGLALAAVLLFVCVGVLFWEETGVKRLPILSNVLHDFGTGPITLRDFFFARNPELPPAHTPWLWWPVTGVAVLGVAVLGVRVAFALASQLRSSRTGEAAPAEGGSSAYPRLFLLLWLVLVIAVPYHALAPLLFDRYLLPCLPPAVLLAAGTCSGRRATAIAWVSAVLLYGYSLACLQDYMAWNRARWLGIDYLLEERGVAAEQIDGGYEYNGLYTSPHFRRGPGQTSFFKQGRNGFWVLDDAYSISRRLRGGSVVLERVPYFSWLGLGERQLLVLRRADVDDSPARRAVEAGSRACR